MIKYNSLILGCARFSGLYGVNSKRQVGLKSIKNICKMNKFKKIDTAVNYRNANQKLRKINIKNFKVSSKIPSYDLSKKTLEKKIYNDLSKHLLELRIKRLDTLFLHNPDQILGQNGKKLIFILKKLKNKKFFKKIGLSVYSPNQLKKLLGVFTPDVVQLPINVFDRRFLKKEILQKINNNKIEIHIRSIFLQGILLKKFSKLPKYFYKWKKHFQNWNDWVNNKQLTKVEGCLSVLNLINFRKHLIIGVETSDQMKEILNSFKVNFAPPVNLSSHNEYLINPSKWKIKK